MSTNGISTLPTKQERQLAKLDIAEARRKGYTTVVPTGSQQVSSDYGGGGYPNPVYPFGSIKVISDGAENTYLVFESGQLETAITSYLYDGAPIHNIRFAGADHFDVVSIVGGLVDCSTLAGLPQAGAVGYLLSASLGVTTNNNVGWVEIPNGRFEGSGIPDTTAPYYRDRNVLDITQLPDTYNGNVPNGDDNPNLGELTLTPGVTQTGIRKVTYTGYHNDDVAFTDTATATASTTVKAMASTTAAVVAKAPGTTTAAATDATTAPAMASATAAGQSHSAVQSRGHGYCSGDSHSDCLTTTVVAEAIDTVMAAVTNTVTATAMAPVSATSRSHSNNQVIYGCTVLRATATTTAPQPKQRHQQQPQRWLEQQTQQQPQ